MEIKDVENLAELARIELSQAEKEKMLADMDNILAYVEEIESIKIDGKKTDFKLYNVWREDSLAERDFDKDLIAKQFPEKQDGFLKVKKIL